MRRRSWPPKHFHFGRDVVNDVRERWPHVKHDWTSGLDAGAHILAPATHVFVLSLIPALAFSQQMITDTGAAIGYAQVLLSTSIFGILQAVIGGQPLLIVGVAEPMVVMYGLLYGFTVTAGLPFLPWVAVVCLWVAAACILAAALGTTRYVARFSPFSADAFGAFTAALFVTQGIRIAVAQFHAPTVDPDPIATAWTVTNGAFGLLLAAGTCATALALRGARSWRVAVPAVRGLTADYGAVLAVIIWTGFSCALTPYSPPPSVPRRLPVAPPWKDRSFWRTAASISTLPGWSIAAAALPAAIIAVLFYFDHSVSAHVALAVLDDGGPSVSATARATAPPKPATYAYDLALLGIMTLVAGLTGLPPVNGVLPQAPMHTHALAVARGVADRAADDDAVAKVTTAASPPASPRSPPPPPPPLETRLAAFLQSVAVGVAALAAPALRTIPTGVIGGYFIYMAIEWMQDCGLAARTLWLATDGAGRARAADAAGAARWRAASDGAIVKFTAIQLAITATAFGLTFAPYGSLAFPLIFMGCVPLRQSVLPRLFAARDLAKLDGGKEEEGDDRLSPGA